MPGDRQSLKRKPSELQKAASKCRKLTDVWGLTATASAQSSGVSSTESVLETTRERSNAEPDTEAVLILEDVLVHEKVNESQSDSLTIETIDSSIPTEMKQSYKGFKIDIKEIQKKVGSKVISVYHEKQKNKTRIMVKCLTCEECEQEAKKFSSNGFVYIGIRCDGEKKIKNVIDHLHSPMHKRSLEVQESKRMWDSQSGNHPWIRILRKNNAKVINRLIKMATTCHNDSKLLTPTAWSWPCRSLSQEHAQNQIQIIEQHGIDSPFVPYEPNASDIHYRDPVTYREMLSVVADLERKRLCENLKSSVRYAVQMDGSVDSTQRDHKFVFVRYNSIDDPVTVETKFVAAKTSELRGSEALLDVFRMCMTTPGVNDETLNRKFAGVTT